MNAKFGEVKKGKEGNAGFTLIELLVTISIFTLLAAVLLPGLSAAREAGRSAKCMANLHTLGQGMEIYLAENNDRFPCSYVFAANEDGQWNPSYQPETEGLPAFGYVHWSSIVGQVLRANSKTFQCPSMKNGGVPRPNPGKDGDNWNHRQIDEMGKTSNDSPVIEDHQAPWLAYTANAAIMPRNKFTRELAGGESAWRINRFVSNQELTDTGKTILLAELVDNWKAVCEEKDGKYLSRSHLPITPFVSASKGIGDDIYKLDPRISDFRYGDASPDFGLIDQDHAENLTGIIAGKYGTQVNTVARHHLMGDDLGGTGHFLYTDTHVEQKTLRATLANHEWGDKYYSLTGNNVVN